MENNFFVAEFKNDRSGYEMKDPGKIMNSEQMSKMLADVYREAFDEIHYLGEYINMRPELEELTYNWNAFTELKNDNPEYNLELCRHAEILGVSIAYFDSNELIHFFNTDNDNLYDIYDGNGIDALDHVFESMSKGFDFYSREAESFLQNQIIIHPQDTEIKNTCKEFISMRNNLTEKDTHEETNDSKNTLKRDDRTME